MKNKLFKISGLILSLLYPFCIFFLLKKGISLRWMSLFLAVLILAAFLRSQKKVVLWIGAVLLAGCLLTDDIFFLKLYPVCMNFLVCTAFLLSLKGTPLITVFAEKMKHPLTPDVLNYTRKATWAWGIFMAINTFVSLITVFLPMSYWTFYNGFLSYILIGLMFGAEYLCRRRSSYVC